MFDWNLTAKTIMSVNEWKKLFKDIGYKRRLFLVCHEKNLKNL